MGWTQNVIARNEFCSPQVLLCVLALKSEVIGQFHIMCVLHTVTTRGRQKYVLRARASICTFLLAVTQFSVKSENKNCATSFLLVCSLEFRVLFSFSRSFSSSEEHTETGHWILDWGFEASWMHNVCVWFELFTKRLHLGYLLYLQWERSFLCNLYSRSDLSD